MDQQSKSSFVQRGDTSDTVTWSGHYSRLKSESSVKPPAEMRQIGANPEFPDETTYLIFNKILNVTNNEMHQFLNAEKTPLLGADRLVNAILTTLQCIFPEEFGKDKFLVVLGFPYIEGEIYLML